MIRNLQEGPNTVEVQETTFSLDVLGRYICNTYDEARALTLPRGCPKP